MTSRTHRLVAALLFLAAFASKASAAVVVTRTVKADEFLAPSREGTTGGCPAGLDRPASGAQIRLSVSPNAARRDEPSLSFIVLLDEERAFVVNHRTRTYSPLAYPPKLKQLATTGRTSVGSEGDELYGLQVKSPIREATGSRDGAPLVTRSATVGAVLGGTFEVSAQVRPDATFGRAAQAVEVLAQSVRESGESWLRTLQVPDGLTLDLSEDEKLPETAVHYGEELVKVEQADLDASVFAPPADYTKARHEPDCF